MWNKAKPSKKRKKLKTELVELICASFLISAFFYLFLSYTSESLADTYLSANGIVLDLATRDVLTAWMKTICFFACIIIFIVIFLVLFGQKIAYLLTIIDGIERLREAEMDFEIALEGNDELTQLAESINFLSRSQRELQEKEQAFHAEREELIHSLSHDIRTPLTSILSYSEYMESRDTLTEENFREYLGLVRKKAEQIKTLSELLLGKERRKPEKVENGLLFLEQLAAEWSDGLEEGFACQTDLSQCQNFQAYLDINEMKRIFDNLLSNVEKYADPADRVSLLIGTKDGLLTLIQRNKKSKIPHQGESLKLGLKSIQGIARAYGGSMEIKEDADNFEITIQIPLRQEL